MFFSDEKQAALRWEDYGKEFVHPLVISLGSCSIGRDVRCTIALSPIKVSRRHALVTYEGDGWYVEDTDSLHGTFLIRPGVGRGRLKSKVALRDADVIEVAPSLLTFSDNPGSDPTSAHATPSSHNAREWHGAITAAQQRVLNALCGPAFVGRGWATNNEIAEATVSSYDTVRTHLKVLYMLFDVPGDLKPEQKRAELIRRAIDEGYAWPAEQEGDATVMGRSRSATPLEQGRKRYGLEGARPYMDLLLELREEREKRGG